MVMTLPPAMEARLANLAQRLGMDGPDAPERALKMAVAELEAKAPPARRKPSPAEVAAEMAPNDGFRYIRYRIGADQRI